MFLSKVLVQPSSQNKDFQYTISNIKNYKHGKCLGLVKFNL